MSKSFPFFSLARERCLDYGLVLRIAEALDDSVSIEQYDSILRLHPVGYADLSAIFAAVKAEDDRRWRVAACRAKREPFA